MPTSPPIPPSGSFRIQKSDDDAATPAVPADQDPERNGTLIAAPRLSLDIASNVVDLDTNQTLGGIVTFGARVTGVAPAESPITTMQRWSDARQGPAKPEE